MPPSNDFQQFERKNQLITATMHAVVEHGFSNLTLAKIASIAGMTAASVNFHFKNKDALLLATLQSVADEYQQHLEAALKTAGDDPLDRLLALCDATLDEKITAQTKMAVWYAFSLEARTRSDYEEICGARDRFYYTTIEQCCQALVARSEYPTRNATAMGYALAGLVDHLWQDFLAEQASTADAKQTVHQFVEAMFPNEFGVKPQPIAINQTGLVLAEDYDARGTLCVDVGGIPVWLANNENPIKAVCGETGLRLAVPGTRGDAKCPMHDARCLSTLDISVTRYGELIAIGAIDLEPLSSLQGWQLVDSAQCEHNLLAADIQIIERQGLRVQEFGDAVAVVEDDAAVIIQYTQAANDQYARKLFSTRTLTKRIQRVVAASNQLAHCNRS